MKRKNHIPKNERKNILFLGDDFRIPSGIGTMSKEIIEGTCHLYNWVQIGAAVKHPEAGQIVDASEEVANFTGVSDASVIVYPYNGYGDPFIVRNIIEKHNIDAILHFTDPRYWVWLYQMEHEIRQNIPILFYTIWDDLPYPYYNENFYRSCDWFGCISKQTYNIVKQVRNRKEPVEPWQLKYVPHGINPMKFYKLTSDGELAKVQKFKEQLFGDKCEDIEFVILYNSRNIRRKMTSDVLLAFDKFRKMLPEEERNKVALLLHTHRVDENGTDLPVVAKDVIPDSVPYIFFSENRLDNDGMNALYNIADVTVNISSNEGFGLSMAESLMAQTPVILNVTGGLQDQAGFVDEEGNFLDPETHYTYEWGSNHDGRYTQHGSWVYPVWPKTRSLVGSPVTPYIFDDRCDWEDVAYGFLYWYGMDKSEREQRGAEGRAFCLGPGGLNSENMCNLFIEGIETAIENFTPRSKFVLEAV